MINTSANTLAHRDMTDLLLQPPLEEIDMLNWKAFDRAIEAGYRYALERIQAATSSLLPPARSGPVKRKRSIELTRRKA